MKNRNIVLGIIFIVAGLLWGLSIIGVLSINLWAAVWKLWPVLIIAVGITLISGKKLGINVITWLITLAVLVTYGYLVENNKIEYKKPISYLFSMNEDVPIEGKIYSKEMESDITNGKLKIDLGVTKIKLKENNDELYEIDSNITSLIEKNKVIGNTSDVHITTNSNKTNISNSYYFDMSINDEIPWDIEANFGAVECNLDFSEIQADDITLNFGAGDIKMYLSDKSKECHLDISSGVANLVIYIPEDVGAMMDYEGALNNIKFNVVGVKKEDNRYKTNNYDEAENKIIINISAGLTNIEVKTYSD